jgi:hypothetical protein
MRAKPTPRFLGLQPGVVANSGGGANRDGAVTGSRTDQGNITLDGIDVNDQAGGFAFSTVVGAPVDSIQEFRTVTASPLSTDGRSSGGQMSLVTKSGSNNFHGNTRYYNRHDKLAANDWFNNKAGVSKPKLRRHQYGGSIGGPAVRDTLFFFFDFEGRRDSSQFANTVRTVPLAHVFEGRLAYINDGPGCTGSSNVQTQPACISTLTAAQVAALDPQGVGLSPALLSFLQSRYPVGDPALGGDRINTGGHIFNSPVSRKDDIYTSRVDYNLGSSHKFFGRFNILRHERDRTDGPVQQFASDPPTTTSQSRDYGWVAGHTWTISPRLINQATVGLTKQVFAFNRLERPSFPHSWTFGGLTAPFTSLSSQGRDVPVWTIRNDITYLRGKHTFIGGFNIRPIRQRSQLTNDFNFVTMGLGGGLSSLGAHGSALRPADILNNATARTRWDTLFTSMLGRIASISSTFNYGVDGNAFPPGTGKNRNFRYDEYEFYFGDTWRATPSLTFSYGVRWQYYPAPFEVNGFQATNDVDFLQLARIRLLNAAAGTSGATAEPLLRYDLSGSGNGLREYYEPDLNNWAPRFGMAYNPSFRDGFLGRVFGDRKTVVRLGGAVTYDRVAGAITFIQDQLSYLFDNTASVVFGGPTPASILMTAPRFTSIASIPTQPTAPVITRPFTPFVDSSGNPTGTATEEFNFVVAQNFRTPYSYSYSFSVQREIPGSTIVELSYVGRLGRSLFAQADASQVLNFVDATSGQALFDAFRAMQQQVQSGAAITPQPWFENQCFAGCTSLIASALGTLVERGSLADVIGTMHINGLLDFNVGMSSQFATNAYIGNWGNSNYNGLLVSVRRRMAQGLQMDFNYTFSHAIDNQSSVTNTVIGGAVCDWTNLRACRGSSDFDVRHIINAYWVYELPFGRGRYLGRDAHPVLDHIIGGWDISGIWTWRTGFAFNTSGSTFPVSYFSGSPVVLTGSRSALKSRVHSDSAGNIQFFNDPDVAAAAFRFPLGGETGTRNVLYGPRFWNVDTAIMKNFRMPFEGHRLQFRWEIFNTFNNPSFALPATNLNSLGTFGRITSTQSSAREMQIALRYEF